MLTLLSIQLWNDSYQRGIESYHTVKNYKDLLRSSCLDLYQRYSRLGKEVLTIIYIVWAVQEKMFIILNACLAETHGIGGVKPVSKSVFTKITKFFISSRYDHTKSLYLWLINFAMICRRLCGLLL